jgi:PPOX class probable F420-dependent enzyme
MIDDAVRRVLDTTVIAHLATLLPDGAPHSVPVWVAAEGEHIAIITGTGYRKTRNMQRDPRVALSMTPIDNPLEPISIRGRVVDWIQGEKAWEVVDRIAMSYIGSPYPRTEERMIVLIEPERQTVGM